MAQLPAAVLLQQHIVSDELDVADDLALGVACKLPVSEAMLGVAAEVHSVVSGCLGTAASLHVHVLSKQLQQLCTACVAGTWPLKC